MLEHLLESRLDNKNETEIGNTIYYDLFYIYFDH